MLKLSANPPILYPENASIAGIAGRWFVAHTKARFEKAFAHELLGREVPFFLPMIERTMFSGGRKRRGMMPLFPGYVFFAGDEQIRYLALATGRLCQVIAAADQRQIIRELSSLHAAICGKLLLDPYPHAAIGRRCRIAAGPLRGLEGIVVQRDQGNLAKVVLQVSILGQGAAIDLDAGLLEALDEH